jgi:TPR repeat protein
MKTIAIIFLFLLSCVWAIAQTPNRSFTPVNSTPDGNGRRLALVIGNGNYSFVSKLNNPLNDANSMAKALRTMGFEVKTSTNANRQNLKDAINEWGKILKANDIALFYYAGHALEVDGVNYLCPTDANPLNAKQVEYETTPINLVMGWMESQRTQTNIILLDACRDNPFKSLFRTVGEEGGLSSMKAPSGTFIGFAASPGKKSSDGDGSNGLYTEAILASINTPNKTIDQIFNSVNAQVRKRSNGSQIPFKSSSLEADFYFSVTKSEVAQKEEPKKEVANILSIDEILKNGNDFLDKKDYVQAKYWYEKGVELNNGNAMNQLGYLYNFGIGVTQDYATAIYWYKKGAELNNSDAMANLGYLYEQIGVTQDYIKTLYWYEKSAELNNGNAMKGLGALYNFGHGVTQDYIKAKYWYEKSAELNDGTAMNNLGVLYQDGQGVTQDYTKAKYWFEKSASLNNSTGMLSLGFLYHEGQGVTQDYTKAKYWYEKSAELNDENAMLGLGYLYSHGQGVTKDYDKAKYWYDKACNLGSTQSCENLKALK